MKRFTVLLPLLGLLTGAAQPAAGKIAAEQAAELVDRSGLALELEQVAPLLRVELEGFEGEFELSEAARAVLSKLLGQAYAPARLVAGVRNELAAALTADEGNQVLDWLSSDLGRRIGSLELAGTTPAGQQAFERLRPEFEAALSADRLALVENLARALDANEASAAMSLDTMLAVTRAAAWVSPPGSRPPLHRLTFSLIGQREQILASARRELLAAQAFTYRELSDSELEKYLRFAESPSGRSYHRALAQALARTLEIADRDLVELARAAAPKTEPAPETEPEPEPEPAPAATAPTLAPPAGRFVEIDLVVRRETGEPIALDDWLAYVDQAPELRRRTEPHIGRNPRTGEPMPIRAGEGDAELVLEEFTVPFLGFAYGALEGRFHLDPDNPLDPQRSRILAVARHFGARVLDRDSDQPLPW